MQLKDVNLTADQVKELCTKYMIETYERFLSYAAQKIYMKMIMPTDFYGGITNSAELQP